MARAGNSPEPDLGKAVVSGFVRSLSELCPNFVRSLSKVCSGMYWLTPYTGYLASHYWECSDCHFLYMCYLSIHYPEPDNCRLISLFILFMYLFAWINNCFPLDQAISLCFAINNTIPWTKCFEKWNQYHEYCDHVHLKLCKPLTIPSQLHGPWELKRIWDTFG